jgi:hypothetical protein
LAELRKEKKMEKMETEKMRTVSIFYIFYAIFSAGIFLLKAIQARRGTIYQTHMFIGAIKKVRA